MNEHRMRTKILNNNEKRVSGAIEWGKKYNVNKTRLMPK